MSIPLTSGAIQRIYNSASNEKPYVQLLEIKRIGSQVQNTQERFRLIVSDGLHYQQAMLATQLNPLVNDNKIRDTCIVQLQEYICNTISNRKIIIILGLTHVSDGNGQTIGSPVNIDGGANVAGVKPASTPAPQPQATSTSRPQQQQQSSYQSRPTGPTTMNDIPIHFYPINQLNPYQNKWTIKARVTNKSEMRQWHKENSNGKLFSVDLLDNSGGQIKATMFNGAADKFFPLFQADKVYTISKGQVKLANKKFNRVPNEYELTLNEDAEIAFFGEDDSISQQKLVYKKISELTNLAADEHVDIIGVVTQVQPITSITSKASGKQVIKRAVTIVDESATQVELTLWGEQAEKYNEAVLGDNAIIAIKQARVGEFQGRNLSASFTSQIFINPEFPEAQELRNWFVQNGNTTPMASISGIKGAGGGTGGHTDQRIVFSEIVQRGLGKGEKPDYFTVRGTVTFFRHEGDKPPWYNACPKCNKKTSADEQNSYHCAGCDVTHAEPNPRYILSLLVCDSTGAQWLTAFNESAEKLIGKTALELSQLKEQNPAAYEQVFSDANFKPYIFKCRAKAEPQNDEIRIRCHVTSAEPVDYIKESANLLQQIALYD